MIIPIPAAKTRTTERQIHISTIVTPTMPSQCIVMSRINMMTTILQQPACAALVVAGQQVK